MEAAVGRYAGTEGVGRLLVLDVVTASLHSFYVVSRLNNPYALRPSEYSRTAVWRAQGLASLCLFEWRASLDVCFVLSALSLLGNILFCYNK